jgi:hypothetical protein
MLSEAERERELNLTSFQRDVTSLILRISRGESKLKMQKRTLAGR